MILLFWDILRGCRVLSVGEVDIWGAEGKLQACQIPNLIELFLKFQQLLHKL